MEFYEFRAKMQEHFNNVSKDAASLFEVAVDKDYLWNLYLDSFPEGTNEIYRERREYDCSCCRGFIKTIGNSVVIKDNKVISLWDFEVEDKKFQTVIDSLSEYIHNHEVEGIFLYGSKNVGTESSIEALEDGNMRRWNHFHLTLPSRLLIAMEQSMNKRVKNYRLKMCSNDLLMKFQKKAS